MFQGALYVDWQGLITPLRLRCVYSLVAAAVGEAPLGCLVLWALWFPTWPGLLSRLSGHRGFEELLFAKGVDGFGSGFECCQRFAVALCTPNDSFSCVPWGLLPLCLGCSSVLAFLTCSCTHVALSGVHNCVSLHAAFICLRLFSDPSCLTAVLLSTAVTPDAWVSVHRPVFFVRASRRRRSSSVLFGPTLRPSLPSRPDLPYRLTALECFGRLQSPVWMAMQAARSQLYCVLRPRLELLCAVVCLLLKYCQGG